MECWVRKEPLSWLAIFAGEKRPYKREERSGTTSGYLGASMPSGGVHTIDYALCQGETEEEVLASTYEIKVAGERFAAAASLAPMYDPTMARIKA